MPGSLVSVIIPVRNRPELLRSSVDSVLRQTYPNVECIIIDDGSTDDTRDCARALASQHPDRLRLFCTEKPASGPGPAREIGRKKARGQYIQYLDSDDLLMPDKLETQVSALEKYPACDIAYGISRLIDQEGREIQCPYKETGVIRTSLFPWLLVDRWWCTHTPLYRCSLVEKIGPWPSFRYSQDWAYDAIAGSMKAKLVYVDAVVSEHREHGGERQTGSGWLAPHQQVSFFRLLLDCATNAGMVSGPEREHFARWVFSAARLAARGGDEASGRALLTLAGEASRTSSRRQMVTYHRISNLLGWKQTAILSQFLERFRQKGPHSQNQSWMD